jgi:hypothetical protein
MEGIESAVVKKTLLISALAIVAILIAIPGPGLYFESGKGARCTSCHEMQPFYNRWHASTHRGIACDKCHGGALTFDVAFHLNNAQRAVSHLRDDLPEQIGFANHFVHSINERCQRCHRQEYAAWSAGPHSASYARIFLNKDHNSKNMLMDDCLRCHGMHFEGGVQQLVTPFNRKGPWKMIPAELTNRPTMPCLTCHQIHREGAELKKTGEQGRVAGPAQEIARPSLALFDRRTQSYVPVSDLSLPAMVDGARAVKMSPDPRQGLCYQCHAPMSTRQIGSGDDRTAAGVHEGIGCLACHAQHGQKTRASCMSCHPKMSNCGLDVEKMDTTFSSTASKHNIHWVKCADCHTKGVPRKKKETNL